MIIGSILPFFDACLMGAEIDSISAEKHVRSVDYVLPRELNFSLLRLQHDWLEARRQYHQILPFQRQRQ